MPTSAGAGSMYGASRWLPVHHPEGAAYRLYVRFRVFAHLQGSSPRQRVRSYLTSNTSHFDGRVSPTLERRLFSPVQAAWFRTQTSEPRYLLTYSALIRPMVLPPLGVLPVVNMFSCAEPCHYHLRSDRRPNVRKPLAWGTRGFT